ncbi:MAG: thiamine pyrophosphate-dependent enzyme, partial [Elusimicrobiota bacterium]
DYSCMGYSVPAAIGAKFADRKRRVVCLAGDGAFLMTGLEMMTAAHHGLGVVFCVLRDRELAQIVQLQRTTLNRDTCGILHDYDLESICRGAKVDFLRLDADTEVEGVMRKAFALADAGRPVAVEVRIDYSQKTFFTKGIVKTNFLRLPMIDRVKKAWRAAGRHLGGKPAFVKE